LHISLLFRRLKAKRKEKRKAKREAEAAMALANNDRASTGATSTEADSAAI
jgi:hypothetical protein